MSYYCSISFKQIAGDDIFKFMVDFKKKVSENFPAIAEADYIFSPYCRDGDKEENELTAKARAWATNSVFKYRWFYLPEHHLLGMFSVHECVQSLFDGTYEFQNSTDQDYEFDYWKGIAVFEQIASKWENATTEQYKELFQRIGTDEDEEDTDYNRKSFAYQEIWDMVSRFLYNEETVIYLTLFGPYETTTILRFLSACKKKVGNWNRNNL